MQVPPAGDVVATERRFRWVTARLLPIPCDLIDLSASDAGCSRCILYRVVLKTIAAAARDREANMRASILIAALALSACMGTPAPDGKSSLSRAPTALPTHVMTSAYPDLGRISMELKHGNPSEDQWSAANRDANSKCKEWGRGDFEVLGTRHYEALGVSNRRYRCKAKHVMRKNAERPALARQSAMPVRKRVIRKRAENPVVRQTSDSGMTAKQQKEVAAWNDALRQKKVSPGSNKETLKLLGRNENSTIYLDRSSIRQMSNNRARAVLLAFNIVENLSDSAIKTSYLEFECNEEKAQVLSIYMYDINGDHARSIESLLLGLTLGDRAVFYPVPNTIGYFALRYVCEKSR